jgi:sorbitol/mannitol transport system permease protein
VATQQTQVLGRALLTPGVALLFIWMIVPLAMTIYFSTLHYNLLDPETEGFVGLDNYRYFLTDPAFLTSLRNTLVLVGSVLAITILLGTPLALLLDGDRAVFRDADRQRAGLEEPADASGLRIVCLDIDAVRRDAD